MPIALSALQAGAGLAQSVIGGIKAHKYQKQLENTKSPTYTGAKSIMDYYKDAQNRYNTNPYQTQGYQYAQNAANRNLAAGVGALQSRHGAISGVSRLSAINNDAMMKAGAMAEQQQSQRFSQLGNATQMQGAEERKMFDINKMQPFERKYSLIAQKASGANKMLNAGLQNMFGGAAGASQISSDRAMNMPQGQQGGGGYYPVDYSTVPTVNTGYGAPPSSLSRTSGSLTLG